MARTVKFESGRFMATPGTLEAIPTKELTSALSRHLDGDWGDLSESDARLNDEAITGGGRIFSAYISSNGVKFWIITEADRSCTTVLLPNEYLSAHPAWRACGGGGEDKAISSPP